MMDLSVPLAGLQRAGAAINQTAKRIAGLPASLDASPSAGAPTEIVDLSAEMVALVLAKNAFSANANVIHAADSLEESLLNILA